MQLAQTFCPLIVTGLLVGCEVFSTAKPEGELTRSECVQMVVKQDKLRNKELGRANSAKQRRAVDRCMEHGTRRGFDCVQFARARADLEMCDRQMK